MKMLTSKQALMALCLCLSSGTSAYAGIDVERNYFSYEDSSSATGSEEIIFIDENVQDFQVLGKEFGSDHRVYVLDKTRDGLKQIDTILHQYQQLQAIHIISHGIPGEIFIGSSILKPTRLTSENVKNLESIGRSLSDNGDILIYGCDFGFGAIGRKSTLTLANVTGADVASSTNATGNSRKNGDWDLELEVGEVDSLPLQDSLWTGILRHCYSACDVSIPHGNSTGGDDQDDDGLQICQDPCPGNNANDCGADLCPNDPDKVAPGICGCGMADTNANYLSEDNADGCQNNDADGDGVTYKCGDMCPNDPLKTGAAGICGCGIPETDSDGDGTPDCHDSCPADPNKTAPGTCGCGNIETDSDGDGTFDCNDQCPADPNKTAPGTCGCGDIETDSDGDGTFDCNDQCPDDPNKTELGICGCGNEEADTNGDGIVDCGNLCPDDPNKTAPGVCGCGIPDSDSDGDGTMDCNDGCPFDMSKVEPGICGCGKEDSDIDANNNGTPDCRDFPWILYLNNFLPKQSLCGETPDFCYMVADGDSLNSEDSPLLKYTFSNGSLEMIGRLGVGMVEAIALSLDGSTLYATDNGTLGVINTTPGTIDAFAPIKTGGIGSGNGSHGQKTFADIDSLAFDPTSGILYGSEREADGARGLGVEGQDLLVKIDHHTGTVIKNGFGQGVDYVVIDTEAINLSDTDDLAFDLSGILYGVAAKSGGGGGDRLVVINKQTGEVNDQGELVSGTSPVQDMEGLTFYHGDKIYGTTGFEFPNRGTTNTLYQINKETGETTAIMRLDKKFNGIVPNDFESVACPVCK